MPSTNWEKIAEIIGEAREMDNDERDAYLVRACCGDEQLLSKVRSLASGADAFPSGFGSAPFDPHDTSQNVTISSVDFKNPDVLVGTVLDGRFLIEKNLTDVGADSGGIGVVYLARDLNLMRTKVVVKILSESGLKQSLILRKFLHEKEALIRLQHPGIVRILDSGNLHDGSPFIVMEFAEGRSLRRLLDERPVLPLDEAAFLIESIGEALTAAHAAKILHRDIKPENIMLTPQEVGFDRVRLIDFGIARVTESELAPATEIAMPMGTPWYMAPEQFLPIVEQTQATDIYSFAVVIFEMLTGNRPFNPRTRAEMPMLQRDGVKTRPREFRGEISAEVEHLLLTALQFEPANRPQTAREFGREIAAGLRVASTPEPPAPVPVPEPLPVMWFGKVAGIALITLLVLGASTAYWIFGRPETKTGNTAPELKSELAANKAIGNPPTGPLRTLTFFAMVQRMRDGQPDGIPFKSTGQELYEDGDEFSLSFAADADGYMFAFNEGPDKNGKTGYYLLYPTPKRNDGSARAVAGQLLGAPRNTFTGGAGTEIVWLIWTKDKSDILEAIKRSVVVAPGAVADPKQSRNLADFFARYGSVDNQIDKDDANKQLLIKGRGDVVVQKFEIQHR